MALFEALGLKILAYVVPKTEKPQGPLVWHVLAV